jgi:hypothetical protein
MAARMKGACIMGVSGRQDGKTRKDFFFEKKKQKTFAPALASPAALLN